MRRSEYIREQLNLLQARFRTLNSDGWKLFESDVLDKLQTEAFTAFIQTAADDQIAIVGWQQRWKIVEEIRKWAEVEVVREAIISGQEALKEIEEAEVLDEEMNIVSHQKPNKLRELLSKIRERVTFFSQ